jgi:hypothetical protein
MAERQERQEHFIVPAEILAQDPRRAIDIAQDRAVMLAHAARRAAGAAGVDDAGKIAAPDAGDARVDRRARRHASSPASRSSQSWNATVLACARRNRFDADHVPRTIGSQHRGQQRLGQLGIRHDHRAAPEFSSTCK